MGKTTPASRPGKARRATSRNVRPPRRAANWRLLGLGGVVLLVIAAIVYVTVQSAAPQAGQEVAAQGAGDGPLGRAVPIQGSQHVKPGESHPPYNSSPPTSGWHYADPARWGVHDAPVVEEAQVHNLEHGGILVQYSCPQGCPEIVEGLKKVVRQYSTKVILAPYPKMESRIALTAWGRIETLEDVDEGRIQRFVAAFVDKGPEKVP